MIFKIPKLNIFANKTTTRTKSAAPMSDLLVGIFSSLPVQRKWLTKEACDRIDRDDQVISSLGSRKAATLKKELIITCDDENAVTALETSLHRTFLDQLLDTPMQGLSVFELNWKEHNDSGYWIPVPIERDYRNFVVKDHILKYDPMGSGTGSDIEPFKAIYTVHRPKHDRPMGRSLYEALYWPVRLKGASLDFWHKFLEKYGVPWAVGKTSGDRDDMAEELYNMLSGDAAVIDEDDSIETVISTKVGDFDKMVSYCDTQIAKVILGGNLTSDVKSGSLAAAEVHDGVRGDIAMADEHIVMEALWRVVDDFITINRIDAAIDIKLADKEDPNIDLSLRDWRISLMGWQPTQEHIEATYGVKVQPMPQKEQQVAAKKLGGLLHFSATKPQDAISAGLGSIDTNPIVMSLQKQMLRIIEDSESFEDAFKAIEAAYPGLGFDQLEEMMASAMMNADILGAAEVEDENPEG